jgi:4-hydroxythreonine-4-phosphate dehydrogenase
MPVIAVTPGEPSGVGPEIALKLIAQHPEFQLVTIADPDLLKEVSEQLELELEIAAWKPGCPLTRNAVNCLPLMLDRPARPGIPDPANGAYVLNTLRTAVRLIEAGHAGALVTGPVHKAVINQAGISFSGHTEFLADLAGVPQVVMMLAAPGLRVTLVTTHLPLNQVSRAITARKLEAVIRITERALRKNFGISKPRLQVLGLNPHAGEGGYLGNEDDEIIRPVIEELCQKGMNLTGPVPADTAFTPPRLASCDAVVAMYHDQGLPVLKHLGFGQAVNITLGLPFVRTSVDHGTALDIAGRGKADISSLLQAVLTAQEMIGSPSGKLR